MEVEDISHSEVSSFQHLDELSHFVDPEFLWSNTSRADFVRLLSQVDPADSLQVEMSPSEEMKAIEKYLKAGFSEFLDVELILDTIPSISTQDVTDTLGSCLKMPPEPQHSTVSNPLSQPAMMLHTVPNVDQQRFVKAPVPIPAPTLSLSEFQQLAPPPPLPGTNNTIYLPYQHLLQNISISKQFYPQQQMSNMPPPMQPQQHHLHPEQKMCATTPAPYPKKLEAPKAGTKNKMKKKHLQNPGDCKLVGQRFTCSVPGCRKVYVKRGHYINHQKIHPVGRSTPAEETMANNSQDPATH